VILIDTGPLVAIIDKADIENHRKCSSILRSLRDPFLTTWPCLTEAMYFIGDMRGWKGQATLWKLFIRGVIRLHPPADDEWKRVRDLMEEYKDTPMSLADASLVVLAERTGTRTIFTLDSDFGVYRINGREPFSIVPLDTL
jgi:predicted nucleic acid-binding protein